MPHADELIIARTDFDHSLRQLLTHSERFATGSLARSASARGCEWIVEQLGVTDALPTGDRLPLITDWVVVSVPADRQSRSASFWREQLRPLPAQTLIALVVGLNDDRSGWQGWVIRGDDERPLAGFRLVGGDYLVTRRSGESTEASSRDSERWSRLRGALGDAVLQSLADWHVMIIGASRTGSIVARELAAVGIGKLTLVDPDRLEPHNLDATVGGDLAHLGRPKVESLAEQLIRFRDDLAVTGLPWTATDRRVLERARDTQMLVTCVDQGVPVLLAAKLANAWNKIHLDIGTGVQRVLRDEAPGSSGAAGNDLRIAADVRLFFPHEACARCVGGIADLENVELDLRLPPGVTPLRAARDWRTERAGSLVTINAIAASVGVQKLLDTLTGHLTHSHWTRLEYRQGEGLRVDDGPVEGAVGCAICHAQGVDRKHLESR
ncbi:MAG: ThiF family adenylyltransferase [Pirellulales bacterium]